jgi:antitoxin (DNA-binding transcriptional repressor) of toxin-antitoxin stability system
MTIHVNIGEAKTRLSELVAAALRGEEVVRQTAGKPSVRLVPLEDGSRGEREAVAKRRVASFGMFRKAFEGCDVTLESLKGERTHPDERERRALGPDL